MLVTRDWMLVIARSRDAVAGISVNALGYAGSLFVRDTDEARLVETIGPLRLLAAVAAPLA
jgi:ATP adenylyltransferase